MSEGLKSKARACAIINTETTSGLSLLGKRTLTFVPGEGASVHDTGGTGEPRTVVRKTLEPEHFSILGRYKSSWFQGLVSFDDDIQVGFAVHEEVEPFLEELEKSATPGEADFDSLIDLAVVARFAGGTERVRERLRPLYPDTPLEFEVPKCNRAASGSLSGWFQKNVTGDFKLAQWFEDYRHKWKSLPSHHLLYERVRHGEFYARVRVMDGRLVLSRGGLEVLQLPLDILRWSAEVRSVRICNQVTVSEELVEEFVLHFPSPRQCARFQKALPGAPESQSKVSSAELSGVVELQGRLNGLVFQQKADALLRDDSLEFRSMDGKGTLCTFDFGNPQLRVSGTSREFVIFDSENGPVTVSGGSELFRRKLNEHELLSEAARRSLDKGPYALKIGDKLSILSLDQGAVVVTGDGSRTFPLQEIERVEGRAEGATASVSLHFKDGSTEQLQGHCDQGKAFHAALRGALLERRAGLDELARGLLGLEGDYFLYTVFAPFYQLEKALEDQGVRSYQDQPVEKLMEWLAVYTQGVADLIRHMDMVMTYLPLVVAADSAEIAQRQDAAGIGMRKAQERNLRKTFMQLSPLVAELQRLRSLLVARTGLRQSKADYGPLAISLVGASIFSPLCLLAGAQHAYSASSRESQMGEVKLTTARESLSQKREVYYLSVV